MSPKTITLYWRPGCGFCMALRAGLRRSGLPVTEVNIWEDRTAAKRVRSFAGGNETVPTVVIGDVALVNPSTRRVLEVVAKQAPELLSQIDRVTQDDRGPRRVSWVLPWVFLTLLLVTSVLVARTGHVAASWEIDAAALLGVLIWRGLRRPVGQRKLRARTKERVSRDVTHRANLPPERQ